MVQKEFELNSRLRPAARLDPAVDELIKAMGGTGVSKSQANRLCEEIDERVKAFLDRPLEGDWPYVWWTPPTSKCVAITGSSPSP
jgi:hypothetical protein